MKIALAQINPTVGDLEGNVEKIINDINKAKCAKAKLVIFPELCITGYPPKDLLNKKEFLKENKNLLDSIKAASNSIYAIVGFVDYDEKNKGRDGRILKYNAAALIGHGNLIGVQYKTLLPTYDVFDEQRYFIPAKEHQIFELCRKNIGIQICEDLWDESYETKVTDILAGKGADLIINISASPFQYGKRFVRQKLLRDKAGKNRVPIIYVNQVGGQDDLVFDGGSMIVSKNGDLIYNGKHFHEDFILIESDSIDEMSAVNSGQYNEAEEIHNALVLGLKDYFRKCGNFNSAVIGLSGGIDSAVTASIAVEALGRNKVIGISMPSQYSSQHSKDDACELAKNLGIRYEVVPIANPFSSYKKALNKMFMNCGEDITEEKLQARIRGNILMALSNKFGYLVVATGNKSELAVGYCTLYGDMSGGFAVLSDVLKTKVYELAHYINRRNMIIPLNTINKAPSAELKPNQIDQDTLPPYNVLDPILKAYVEEEKDREDVVKLYGNIAEKVITMVDSNEFKRRQAPLGPKITSRAFGSGRQMPIINKFK